MFARLKFFPAFADIFIKIKNSPSAFICTHFFNTMACWRCVICFVFVALTLKSLLSHINTAHSRNADFRVICGIDGCTEEEYRVFNSFYYHITRTHALYLTNGRPNPGWMTSTSEPSRVGGEHFDIPVFSDCTTQTSVMQRASSEVNTPATPNEISLQELHEDFPIQRPDHQVRCNVGCLP